MSKEEIRRINMNKEESSFNVFEKMIANYINADTQLIDKLIDENTRLKEELKNKSVIDLEEYAKQDTISVLGKEYISKDIIRKFIKEELPDDEIMETCEMFDINGVYLRKKLEELLGE